ncbi:MAG: flagellar biosynthesis protein FliQ [Clostridia bacterium]|jgi:flagellar biosynthetic protein FliQ|nr:flagellar biosynthesis protein FliQ [Clostridiaceae bacterium]
MGQADAVTVIQQALLTVIEVAAPVLAAGLVIGIIVSIIQAATQVNEQSLGFITKIIAIFLALIFFGPWMINKLTDFTMKLYEYMAATVR